MNNDERQVRCALQIAKPVTEVFDAVVDPEKMKNYWISQSTGRIEEGKTLTWGFPEFEFTFPVDIGKVQKDKYISWRWDMGKLVLLVEITFSEFEGDTVVTITEKAEDGSDPGIAWIKNNTEGWANFLASLKAYVEHGVNLRKKAFDFRSAEFANMK